MGPPALYRDQRGLAYRIILYAGTGIGGILFWIALRPAFSDMMDIHSRQTDTQAASTGAEYITLAMDWAPLIIIFLMGVLILAAAVVESRRP